MKRWWFIAISWNLMTCYVSAQAYDEALNKWTSHFPAEKIYIHYDQEYYVAGETIWFKAYLYADGKPAVNSSNLFIQFTNNKGQVISSNQYPILGAVASGSIAIPDSLQLGDYYMRAFTPGMITHHKDLVYTKMIAINGAGSPARLETPAVSLQFFPESGHFVDGIMSTVAFKALDQWGMPVPVEGTIRSDDGTVITSFRSYHDGMGKIQITPQGGTKYIADVSINGQSKKVPLPEVQLSGINLHIEDEKGGKLFQLTRSEKNKKDFDIVTLVVHVNQHVVYENEIGFEDYLSVKGHLLTDSIPSGILHFTVFNKSGLPLAERLAFVDNGEYRAAATIEAVKTVMGKRAENTIGLRFPDGLQRSCSVTVIDGSVPGTGDAENIYSRLLLTGDLKGYVYNPAWYFQKREDSTKQAIDDLLLTHGWSRFNWARVLAKETPAGNNVYPYMLTVSGKVMDDKGKSPYTEGVLKIYLESEDSTTSNYGVIVDPGGKFRIDSLLFFGKAKLFYAYTDRSGKLRSAKVYLDEDSQLKNLEIPPVDITASGNVSVNPTITADITRRSEYARTRQQEIRELERVTIQAKYKKPADIVNEKYTTGFFRGQSKVTLDNINNPVSDKTINVVDYIRNRIQQVELQGNGFVNRKNFSMSTGQRWPVGVFLNEIPTDIASLRSTRITEVALVKFFEAGFAGVGSGSPGGAIAVYTKERFDGETRPDKLDHVVYNGYTITKEFYQPDYKAKDFKQPSTDQRSTLFWNPDVYFDDSTTTLQFSFFNNDAGKKYKVIVEGFDAAGRLIHVEKVIGE